MKMQNCEVNRGMGNGWVKQVDEQVGRSGQKNRLEEANLHDQLMK